MLTLRQAIDKTLSRISLAQGVDVQTYAEEPIKEMIQHKFDVLFDEYWWPQFRYEGTFTLDGTTGVITGDISPYIKDYKDIKRVFSGTSDNFISRIPDRVNPANIKRLSIAPSNNPLKVFKIYPVTTTGTVTVVGRTHPDPFEEDTDVINFDQHLIILGTAYDYLNGIGTNPAEEEKLLGMFNMRLEQLAKLLPDQQELELDSYTETQQADWQEIN